MAKLSPAEKRQYVDGWRTSGLTQQDYCAQFVNVSARTLRAWARASRRPDGSLARARAVVAEAVEELQAILASLEAAEAEAGVATPGCDSALGEAAAGPRNDAGGLGDGVPVASAAGGEGGPNQGAEPLVKGKKRLLSNTGFVRAHLEGMAENVQTKEAEAAGGCVVMPPEPPPDPEPVPGRLPLPPTWVFVG